MPDDKLNKEDAVLLSPLFDWTVEVAKYLHEVLSSHRRKGYKGSVTLGTFETLFSNVRGFPSEFQEANHDEKIRLFLGSMRLIIPKMRVIRTEGDGFLVYLEHESISIERK